MNYSKALKGFGCEPGWVEQKQRTKNFADQVFSQKSSSLDEITAKP